MHVLKSSQYLALTARETDVIRHVADGFSAKETAIKLNIAPCTVERHVENVRLKTRSGNRAHKIEQVMTQQLI